MTGLIFDFSDETFPHSAWERDLINVIQFNPRSPSSLVIHPTCYAGSHNIDIMCSFTTFTN